MDREGSAHMAALTAASIDTTVSKTSESARPVDDKEEARSNPVAPTT